MAAPPGYAMAVPRTFGAVKLLTPVVAEHVMEHVPNEQM